MGRAKSVSLYRWLASLVQSIDPEPASLQLLKRLADIADTNYGKVLQRTGCSFGHCFGQAGRAAFGNQNGGRSRGVRGADDRAQVVRILDAVQAPPAIARRRQPARDRRSRAPPRTPQRPDARRRSRPGRALRAVRSAAAVPRSRAASMISCSLGPPAPRAINTRSSTRPARSASRTGCTPPDIPVGLRRRRRSGLAGRRFVVSSVSRPLAGVSREKRVTRCVSIC